MSPRAGGLPTNVQFEGSWGDACASGVPPSEGGDITSLRLLSVPIRRNGYGSQRASKTRVSWFDSSTPCCDECFGEYTLYGRRNLRSTRGLGTSAQAPNNTEVVQRLARENAFSYLLSSLYLRGIA